MGCLSQNQWGCTGRGCLWISVCRVLSMGVLSAEGRSVQKVCPSTPARSPIVYPLTEMTVYSTLPLFSLSACLQANPHVRSNASLPVHPSSHFDCTFTSLSDPITRPLSQIISSTCKQVQKYESLENRMGICHIPKGEFCPDDFSLKHFAQERILS